MKKFIAYILLTSCLATSSLLADSLTIQISGVTGTKGEIRLVLFNQADGFPDEVSLFRGKTTALSEIDSSGKTRFHFTNVKPGDYAVSVYHDKNGNKQLDKNFLGFPKEPYGISNNIRARLGLPTFESAKFKVEGEDETISLVIK